MSRYDVDKFVPPPDQELVCCICTNVLDEPMECPCRHVFCKVCIETWLNNKSNCPSCRDFVEKRDLKPVLPLVRNLLNKLTLMCLFMDNGCKDMITLEKYPAHVEDCGYEIIVCKNKNCSLKMLRKLIKVHEEQQCAHREIKCKKKCALQIPLSEIDTHDCLEALKNLCEAQEKEICLLKAQKKTSPTSQQKNEDLDSSDSDENDDSDDSISSHYSSQSRSPLYFTDSSQDSFLLTHDVRDEQEAFINSIAVVRVSTTNVPSTRQYEGDARSYDTTAGPHCNNEETSIDTTAGLHLNTCRDKITDNSMISTSSHIPSQSINLTVKSQDSSRLPRHESDELIAILDSIITDQISNSNYPSTSQYEGDARLDDTTAGPHCNNCQHQISDCVCQVKNAEPSEDTTVGLHLNTCWDTITDYSMMSTSSNIPSQSIPRPLNLPLKSQDSSRLPHLERDEQEAIINSIVTVQVSTANVPSTRQYEVDARSYDTTAGLHCNNEEPSIETTVGLHLNACLDKITDSNMMSTSFNSPSQSNPRPLNLTVKSQDSSRLPHHGRDKLEVILNSITTDQVSNANVPSTSQYEGEARSEDTTAGPHCNNCQHQIAYCVCPVTNAEPSEDTTAGLYANTCWDNMTDNSMMSISSHSPSQSIPRPLNLRDISQDSFRLSQLQRDELIMILNRIATEQVSTANVPSTRHDEDDEDARSKDTIAEPHCNNCQHQISYCVCPVKNEEPSEDTTVRLNCNTCGDMITDCLCPVNVEREIILKFLQPQSHDSSQSLQYHDLDHDIDNHSVASANEMRNSHQSYGSDNHPSTTPCTPNRSKISEDISEHSEHDHDNHAVAYTDEMRTSHQCSRPDNHTSTSRCTPNRNILSEDTGDHSDNIHDNHSVASANEMRNSHQSSRPGTHRSTSRCTPYRSKISEDISEHSEHDHERQNYSFNNTQSNFLPPVAVNYEDNLSCDPYHSDIHERKRKRSSLSYSECTDKSSGPFKLKVKWTTNFKEQIESEAGCSGASTSHTSYKNDVASHLSPNTHQASEDDNYSGLIL